MAARLRQVVATALASIAPLVLLELGLRAAGWPTERVRTIGKLLNVDPQSWSASVGVFRPATTATVLWPPELSYTVHVNALGLRGADIGRAPVPGRIRVLALGDSMTFGYYLEDDETWPFRLEEELRAADLDAEVVNGGVGGWSIDSETLFLEERALALRPDHVVLAYCVNDLYDLERERPVYVGQKAAVGNLRGPFARAVYASALYELYLRAQVAWKQVRERWRGEEAGFPIYELEPEREARLWSRYADWLDRLHGTLRKRGIGLTLVYVPNVARLERGLPAPAAERLAALAADRGLGFVSPRAAFEGPPLESLFHLPLDGHLAAEGAALIADAVAERLVPELRERVARPGGA